MKECLMQVLKPAHGTDGLTVAHLCSSLSVSRVPFSPSQLLWTPLKKTHSSNMVYMSWIQSLNRLFLSVSIQSHSQEKGLISCSWKEKI